MEKGLLEKTGKELSHWIKVVQDSKIIKHKGIIDFLKSEHNFTYGFANFVAHKTKESLTGAIDTEELVTNQYIGKESLFPIYQKLIEEVKKLGPQVTITPKKGSVSFIRKKQFTLIKPATKTRIDLGLKLKDVAITERLENSGPFGSMCTHRVKISNIDQIDEELLSWIKLAFEKAQ